MGNMTSPQQAWYVPIPMEELLDILMRTFKEHLEIVTNLKTEKRFDLGTEAYLYQVMRDTENNLHELNASYRSRPHEQQRPHTSHSGQRPVRSGGMAPQFVSKGDAEYRNNAERLRAQLENARNEIDRIKRAADHDHQNVMHLSKLLRETKVTLDKSEKEKSDYIIRLSKLASDKLTLGNPDVTDLSDPNRPTKLSEIYKEVYDNEWTDAYEVLTGDGHSKSETINILRLTLQEAVDFSREKAGKLLKITEETVSSLFEDYGQTLQRRTEVSNVRSGSQTFTAGVTATKAQPEPNDVATKDRMETAISTAKQTARSSPLDIESTTQTEVSNDRSGSQTFTAGVKGSTEGLVREDSTMNMICVKWQARTAEPSTTNPGGIKPMATLVYKPNIMQYIKTMRKQIAHSLVPTVQKAYLKPRWTPECHALLKPFIRKCIYVGWLMCVQDPPMVLMETDINTDRFDKAYYTYFDNIGPWIEYVVWPPMLIQERGALLCKGVAQGRR